MTDQSGIAIVSRLGQSPAADAEVSGLLAAYHLRTEEEKGRAVDGVGELPERYRAEILTPRAAFANDVVLVAVDGAGKAVGCLVLTAPVGKRSEIKRLWTDPSFRGRGVASALMDAALARCARDDISTVELSVWKWRTGAVDLYGRLGFAVAESWDERGDLVCMRRAV
ncbi:GNAT family N-acetyltransferase [Streptomyces sp. SPB162]|uniref:GNAT family N-acetyltransferase n=1 Tax=Streptomyces sp. SPB162 TaxID=2940560 RepID=UPI002407402B|nr:GNAT family N-acetyltransferase [Streptomyces sp. SPB162]